MIKDKPIFIIDIPHCSIGECIAISGMEIEKKKFSNRLVIWIRDITGTIAVRIESHELNRWSNVDLNKGVHLKIVGQVKENNRGERILCNLINIELLSSLKTKYSELDIEMREQASRMLMSRMCRDASDILRKNNFIEIETKLISRTWDEEGLEPLKVIYPGFGAPATLVPSPSAQVMEFLITTMASRAFTISSTFTSSFRFPYAATEMRIIVAKAIDIDLEHHIKLFEDVLISFYSMFDKEMKPLSIISGNWPNDININLNNNQENELHLVNFNADIPVIGVNWNTRIKTIIQLADSNHNILAEGSREHLSEDIVISSFTMYPSQFLGLVEKAPMRQLGNLGRLYSGEQLYK